MKLRAWVKYLLGAWCILDIFLIVLCLYMMRLVEIGGV